jgi:RNA recognition motif-containing protein
MFICRVSSSTTLFVANLPFSVDDKELAEIFSKNLKVVNAHVVKKRNTRSKGFGFVEFENEADQQAALKEFDGFTVHERVLNVKVALTAVPGEESEKPEEGVVPAEGEKKEEAKAEPPKEEAAAPAEGEKKGQ